MVVLQSWFLLSYPKTHYRGHHGRVHGGTPFGTTIKASPGCIVKGALLHLSVLAMPPPALLVGRCSIRVIPLSEGVPLVISIVTDISRDQRVLALVIASSSTTGDLIHCRHLKEECPLWRGKHHPWEIRGSKLSTVCFRVPSVVNNSAMS